MTGYDPVDPGDPKTRVSLPLNTLHGIAGELLVKADLMMRGYWPWEAAYHAAAPYDILVEVEGQILRVQVKSVAEPRWEDRSHHGQGTYNRGWQFSLRKGVGAKERYEEGEVDIIALVALDAGRIAYRSMSSLKTNVGIITTLNLKESDFDEFSKFPPEASNP